MVRGTRYWEKKTEDKAIFELRNMKRKKPEQRFVVCVRNDDCEDLELRKIYQVLPDEAADKDGYVRIIDESGEDYLYPADYFLQIELSKDLEKAMTVA